MKYVVIPVTGFEQNCTVLWCDASSKAAVIDPGGDVATIRKALSTRGLQLDKILVTHGHIDHAGGAHDLSRAESVPIWGPHRADAFWVDAMEKQSQMFGLPGARTFVPERWLVDGDRIAIGELTLEVLHCPGHTPGHVVFFHRPSAFAQVGDVLFKGSIGRTDFPGGDHDALLASIRNQLWPLGDEVVFVSGHGPSSSFGEERRNNPFVRA